MKPSERLLLCLPPAGQHAEEAQDVRGISQQGLHPGCVPTHAPCTAGPCTHVLTHTCTHMLSYTRTHTCTHMLSYTCTHVHTHVHTCVQCPPHAYCACRHVGSCEHTHTHCLVSASIPPCCACPSVHHRSRSPHAGLSGGLTCAPVLSVFPDLSGGSLCGCSPRSSRPGV